MIPMGSTGMHGGVVVMWTASSLYCSRGDEWINQIVLSFFALSLVVNAQSLLLRRVDWQYWATIGVGVRGFPVGKS